MFNLCSSTWPKSQLRADWAQKNRILTAARASLAAAEAGNCDAFHVQDREFHAAIAAAVGNVAMDEQIARCTILIHTVVDQELLPDGDEIVHCAKRHVRIAEAIRIGDARAASLEMMDHLRSFHALVIERREAGSVMGVAAE